MKSISLKQPSFSGGQLSPQMLSRSDQGKYAQGLRVCSNAIIQRFGALQSRPGTIYNDTVGYVTQAPQWPSGIVLYPGNTVAYNGNEYICIKQTLGNGTDFPPNATYWAAVPATMQRPVKFVFNYTNSYQFVFSLNNIRIFKNGVALAVPLASMAAWSSVTAYVIGNIVSSGGIGYVCQQPSTNRLPSIGIARGAYWSPMQVNASGNYIIDIPINYSDGTNYINLPVESLATLQAVNYNSIMTVVSQSFRPFQVTRYSDTDWRVTPYTTQTNIAAPSSPTVIPGNGSSAGSATPSFTSLTGGTLSNGYYWYITSYDATGESLPGVSNGNAPFADPTAGTPVVLTWGAVSGASGYMLYRGQQNTTPALIAVTNLLTFTDNNSIIKALPAKTKPASPTGTTTFTYVVTAVSATDGSESLPSVQFSCTGGLPGSTTPNILTWLPVAGASAYNVYRIIGGIPGFVGTTTVLTFNDINIQPNYSQQPPASLANADGSALFSTIGNWPAAVCYFQQRLAFANTVIQPTSVWMSRVGSFNNFSVTTPVQDSGALQFVVAGKSAQPIIAMIDLQKFIIHTASAEYACTGNQYGTITPTAINVVQQGSAGCSLPAPIVIGNTDLYVQARATQIRDLKFEIGSYTYTGKDLTIFNTQAFQGLTIVDMDWQQIKDSIVWCVMSNGALYGLTYVKEHEIWAWHQHSFTNGFVERVCVVPNAANDVVYLIVRRVINGQTVRYLESLSVRDFSDTVYYSDFIGCDASISFNGTATDGGLVSIYPAGINSIWGPGVPDGVNDLIAIFSTSNVFSSLDVTNKNQIILSAISADGTVTDRIAFKITNFISATHVEGYPLRKIPAWAKVQDQRTWGKAVTKFTGASHLIGQSVSILSDGNVAASPLNPSNPPYLPIVVDGTGSFSLPSPALNVTVGLPVQVDIQTMPVENVQGETISNKHVQVRECCPIFAYSRDGLFGQDQNHLLAWKQPRGANPPGFTYGLPVAPMVGPQRVPIMGTSQTTGQVWIRVVDPVPFAMSGIVLTVEIAES